MGSDYKLHKTEDGSETVYLSEYDEHMHTLSGAYSEAVLKHIKPSGLLVREKESIKVLDVGFGLGYNILALLAEAKSADYNGIIEAVSLEKRSNLAEIFRKIRFNDFRDEIYNMVKSAYADGFYYDDRVKIEVKIGDARISIKELGDEEYDAIFFDPFSPSRNPELWTVDFLREIYRVMNNDGILTTYSSASQVRSAMREVGFTIGRGPSFGMKKESTIAAKTAIIDSLSDEELRILEQDTQSIPYRDLSLRTERREILKNRSIEIKGRKERI